MLKIRLNKGGKKKLPHYGIVIISSTKKRDGEFIEKIGHYHPTEKDDAKKTVIKADRFEYWIEKGAKPSERVAILAAKNNIELAKKFLKPYTPREKGAFEKKKK